MLSLFSQFIFGSSSLFGTKDVASGSSSWRDRSLCFDLQPSDLQLDHGEILIACFFPIEDIKGNQDIAGLLKVTNLRLIWICCSKKRVNLSIGWRTVSLSFVQNLKDSLGMPMTSLCILTNYESTKYEFVFNKMSADRENLSDRKNFGLQSELLRYRNNKSLQITHLTPMYLADPFDVVFKVWQNYKQTQLFRHCRANIANLIPTDEESRMTNVRLVDFCKLPDEKIIDIYSGIQRSDSKSVKYTGSLMITNIRIVWVDEILHMRNLSIPYTRVESIKLKQTDRIIIHTYDYLATSNQIELRASSSTTGNQANRKSTKLIFDQLQNLCSLYKGKPRFGPESCEECIDLISLLRPIENYIYPLDDGTGPTKTVENLGPALNPFYLVETQQQHPAASEKIEIGSSEDHQNKFSIDESMDRNEKELNRCIYLNDQPIEHDKEIMYSQEVGLAIERPFNGLDLGRIWHLDL